MFPIRKICLSYWTHFYDRLYPSGKRVLATREHEVAMEAILIFDSR